MILSPLRGHLFQIVGMGDMSTLVKQIKDTIGDDKNDEMMEKFSKASSAARTCTSSSRTS